MYMMIEIEDVARVVELYLKDRYVIKSNQTSVSNEALYAAITAFLSIEDLMELLDLSRPTITKLIKTGDLPAAKIGNKYRIRKEDFEDFWQRKINEQQEAYRKRFVYVDNLYTDLISPTAGQGGRKNRVRKHKEYKQDQNV